MPMDKTRAAHGKLTHARVLVVRAALALSQDFDDMAARSELKSALKAERRARQEFEQAIHADEETETDAQVRAGPPDGHTRTDGDGK